MTTNERLINLLKQHNLNITQSRVIILEFFLNTENSLDKYFIEKKARHHLDRITVYRTLRAFVKKGIIHTIPTHDFSVQYALSKNDCDESGHLDNHFHLICEKCGKGFCLDENNISISPLPKGYVKHKVEVLITGLCKKCAAK